MANLTIRNVSDEVIERVKNKAARHGRSMEQELRLHIEQGYQAREDVLRRIEERWRQLPDNAKASPEEIEGWIREGRE